MELGVVEPWAATAWAPLVAALVSLGVLLRFLLRYEKTFVDDARKEVDRVRVEHRAEVEALRNELALAKDEHRAEVEALRNELALAKDEITRLREQVRRCRTESYQMTLEVERLRRAVEER